MKFSQWIVLTMLLTGCFEEVPPAELKLQEVEQVVLQLGRADLPPHEKLRLAARGSLALQELTSFHASSPQGRALMESGLAGLSHADIQSYFEAYESLCNAHMDEFVWHFTLQDERLQRRYRWWLNQTMIEVGNDVYVVDDIERLTQDSLERLAWHSIGAQKHQLATHLVNQLEQPSSALIDVLRGAQRQAELEGSTSINTHRRGGIRAMMVSGNVGGAHERWLSVVNSSATSGDDKRDATQMLLMGYIEGNRFDELHSVVPDVVDRGDIETLGMLASELIKRGHSLEASKLTSVVADSDKENYRRKMVAYLSVYDDVDEALTTHFQWRDASAEQRFLLLGEMVRAYSETGYCDYREYVNWAELTSGITTASLDTGLLEAAK